MNLAVRYAASALFVIGAGVLGGSAVRAALAGDGVDGAIALLAACVLLSVGADGFRPPRRLQRDDAPADAPPARAAGPWDDEARRG